MLFEKDSEIKSLLSLSARIGCDPSLAQASSGNTSLKRNGILWIKASGKWLAEAEQGDILVPLHLKEVRSCSGEIGYDGNLSDSVGNPASRFGGNGDACGLPSRVVVHVHSVNTIAMAVRQDAYC